MLELLSMIITHQSHHDYYITIQKRYEKHTLTHIIFNPELKTLYIDDTNPLGEYLKSNEYQLRKLLHNKRPRTYKVGFKLDFSIISNKDIAAFNDKNNLIIQDHGKLHVIKESHKTLIEIYTDGSFDELSEKGAYGYIILSNGRILTECYALHPSKSSSHLELIAVIEAIGCTSENELRIFTDSQYVRKGITEWIYHWRDNNFMTANGTKAKNVEDWKKLDLLTQDNYIEWVWIKSHRDNDMHNRVDQGVRNKAKSTL